MHLDLSDDETGALIRELHDIVESDKFPFSPRIRTLREILGKLRPEPVRKPLPPPKVYAPPRATAAQKATARVKSEPGPPMTLGGAAAAGVRLIVWCRQCRHRVEPDPAELAARLRRRDQRARVAANPACLCSRCGGREVDKGDSGKCRTKTYEMGFAERRIGISGLPSDPMG
jgi:hypothetical protein